jgi:hypothetical protein
MELLQTLVDLLERQPDDVLRAVIQRSSLIILDRRLAKDAERDKEAK